MNRLALLLAVFNITASLYAGPLDEAKSLEARGSLKEAIAKYCLWLKDHSSDENFDEILFHTADLFISPKDAVAFLKQASDEEKDKSRRSRMFEKMASLSEILGDYENSQKFYEFAYKIDSKNASLFNLFKSSQLLFELGEFQTSEEQVRVVANASKDPDLKKRAIFHLARIMAATGRELDAIKLAKRLTEDPSYVVGNEGIFYFIADLAKHMKDEKEAAEALEKLKKDYPETIEAGLAFAAKNGRSILLFPSPIFHINPAKEEKGTISPPAHETGKPTSVRPEQKRSQASDTLKKPGTISPQEGKHEPSAPDSIQTGSFSVKENAEFMMKDLKTLGFEASVREAVRPDGKKIYKVIIPLSAEQKTPDGTQKALILLKEKGIEGFLLFQ